MTYCKTVLIPAERLLVMDQSVVQRGLTSLLWFLSSHSDELSGDLLWALGEGKEVRDRNFTDLIHRIHDLSHDQLEQLCSVIQRIHRSYFGTMSGRELSSFLQKLASENSGAPR